ncbi:flavonol 3-O-glucosyltransferase UGT89B1-like [Solanum dulcamara]|uniref:flavonol 3-O-glucosyltransferase UGT89B1-like n=1 Tax=Solanum dulcamara TaxID=45834 RepID=UPI00248664FB|nr:flavonol 3-O-glucosyltransferase UGT89B1-like [Solanum dulcamara]
MEFSGDNNSGTHVLLFPFPTSGHIIPLLDLANHLINHSLKLTILVTPLVLPLIEPIQEIHPSDSIQTLVLSVPETPPGSNFATRVRATSKLYDPIIDWFHTHPSPPVAIISDFFLGWTLQLACRLGVRRIAFWPSGAFTCLVMSYTWSNVEEIFSKSDENTLVTFNNIPNTPEYPRLQVCTLSSQYKKGDSDWEFLRDGLLDNVKSWGTLFNTCREIEGLYIDQVKKEMGHDRVWAVGPLLNVVGPCYSQRGGLSAMPHDEVMTWLDDKVDDSVVYVCFGSRSILTRQQTAALATSLERSGVNFVWCLRIQKVMDDNEEEEDDPITKEYENRIANRGLIIKGWAPQLAILKHRAVGIFLTHCGWNSILEGISSKVLMLTWPMGADQFIGEELLVNELKVGIKACEGGSQVELTQILCDSIGGARSQKERMRKLHDGVAKAVQEGGSSSQDFHVFVKQLCQLPSKKPSICNKGGPK